MKLDMVGIIVSDMETAINFYELLGLTPTFWDKNAEYVELSNEGVRMSLNTRDMIEQVLGFKPEPQGDKIELAFIASSISEVDALITNMSTHHHEIIKQPWQAPWGQYYGLVRDPDGNIISIFYEENNV
ncbi:MAG: VOC family protein [Vagococcus sp.]